MLPLRNIVFAVSQVRDPLREVLSANRRYPCSPRNINARLSARKLLHVAISPASSWSDDARATITRLRVCHRSCPGGAPACPCIAGSHWRYPFRLHRHSPQAHYFRTLESDIAYSAQAPTQEYSGHGADHPRAHFREHDSICYYIVSEDINEQAVSSTERIRPL